MIKLLIDTCVWLDLAKSSKWEKVLNILEEFIKIEEVSLILPEIVIEEFNRNKERIIKGTGKSLSSHFDIVKQNITMHSNVNNKDDVISHLNDINHKISTLWESAISSIQRIEKLFSDAELIILTDEIQLKASQRAINKKAPFHLNKNSIGDSIIIESYDNYKANNESSTSKLIFVTHNKEDFSLKNWNQKLPHEDFSDIFDGVQSQYFISLPEVFSIINPDLVKEIELENDWYEPRLMSEIVEVEYELTQKIWYNRHKIREYKIQTGEIKIINREDFDAKTINSTIIDDIWEWAKKSAKAIEEKYWKENLVWDDFEWWMLNWKLSALRWVNGEDWDELYT